MKLLALDAATERCSVALWLDGEVLERVAHTPRAHAELVLPMADALLAAAGLSPSQLDAIAFGRGPGGFTGLRVAAALTQGLAFGAGLPVVPVSDLAALATGGARRHSAARVLACLDARMGELYWCAYAVDEVAQECTALTPERLGSAAQVQPPQSGPWWGVGSGFQAGGDELRARLGAGLAGVDAALLPAAADVARLAAAKLRRGEVCSPEQALPVYLRDRVAGSKAQM